MLLASSSFVVDVDQWQIATGESITGVVGIPLRFGGLGGLLATVLRARITGQ